MDNLTAGAIIIGLVNGVRLASDKVTPFIAFLISLGAGLVFGAFHLFGLTVETGIAVALASSGLYQVAKKVGGK